MSMPRKSIGVDAVDSHTGSYRKHTADGEIGHSQGWYDAVKLQHVGAGCGEDYEYSVQANAVWYRDRQ